MRWDGIIRSGFEWDNGVGQDGMERDGMGCDVMGSDGVNWGGVGWDNGMGRDGTGCVGVTWGEIGCVSSGGALFSYLNSVSVGLPTSTNLLIIDTNMRRLLRFCRFKEMEAAIRAKDPKRAVNNEHQSFTPVSPTIK